MIEYDRKRGNRRSLACNLIGVIVGVSGSYYGITSYYAGDYNIARVHPVLFASLCFLAVITCSNSLVKLWCTRNNETDGEDEK